MSVYKYNLLKGYENLDYERQRVNTYNNNITEAYRRLAADKGSDGLNADALVVYNKMDSAIKKQQADEQARVKAEREATPWIERAWKTAADFGGRVVGGVMKFGENVMDLGATVFGADEEWMKKDHVKAVYGDKLDDYTKSSYMNDSKVGKWVQGAVGSVGNMLPSIALSAVVPGLGTASFMASAAGGGMESSLQQGATRGQAIAYGTLAGLAEGTIEKLSGGIGGVGKGVMDKMISKGIGKSIKNNAGRAIAKTTTKMIGEGLEEVAMDVIDPLLASTYKGKVDYSGVNMSSLADTFMTGALTGGVMQGGSAIQRKASPTTDIKMRLGEINEIQSNLTERYNQGKLTEAQYNQGIEDVNYLREKIVNKIDRRSEVKQGKIITALGGANNGVNAIKQSVVGMRDGLDRNARKEGRYDQGLEKLGNMGVQLSAQEGKKAISVKESTAGNSFAMSPSLAVSRQKLEFQPTKNAPTKEQLDVIKEHGKLSGGKSKIVFTDDLGTTAEADGSTVTRDGAYKDGVIYISTKTKNPMRTALVHEFDHFVNNMSGEHINYAKYVAKELDSNDSAVTSKYGKNADIIKGVLNDYGMDKATDDGGNEVEQLKRDVELRGEVTARYAEKLFTDPKAISRLARANKGKAKRALGYITDKISYLTKKGNLTKQEREVADFLTTAEGLYRKAMRVASVAPKKTPHGSSDEEKGGLVQYYQHIDKDFKEYVEKIKNGEEVPKRYTLGEVSQKQVDDIKRLTGEDVRGYSNAIGESAVKHIIKRHGKDGQHDHSMAKSEDIALIQYVLENYDSIRELNATNGAFADTTGTMNTVLEYSKSIGKEYYVIQVITTGKYKKLQVITAYQKKAEKKETPRVSDAFAPQQTPDSAHESVSNNSISNNLKNVNTKVSNQPKTVDNTAKDSKNSKNNNNTNKSTANQSKIDKPQYSQRREGGVRLHADKQAIAALNQLTASMQERYVTKDGEKYRVSAEVDIEYVFDKMLTDYEKARLIYADEKVIGKIIDYIVDNTKFNTKLGDQVRARYSAEQIADINSYFDKLANGIRLTKVLSHKKVDAWARDNLTTMEGGLALSKVVAELARRGINIKASTPAGQLKAISDAKDSFRNAVNRPLYSDLSSANKLNEYKLKLGTMLVKKLATAGVVKETQTKKYFENVQQGIAARQIAIEKKRQEKITAVKTAKAKSEQATYHAKNKNFSIEQKIMLEIGELKKIDPNKRLYKDGILAQVEMHDLVKSIIAIYRNGRLGSVESLMKAFKTAQSFIKNYSEVLSSNAGQGFSQDVIDAVDMLVEKYEKNGVKYIEDNADLKSLLRIVRAVKYQYENHNVITIKGEKMQADDVVERMAIEMRGASTANNMFSRSFKKVSNLLLDPRTVIAGMFGAISDDSQILQLFNELARCGSLSELANIRLCEKMEKFLKKNASYDKALVKRSVELCGVKIELGEAINLVMQTSQDGVDERLKLRGVYGYDGKERVNIKSITKADIDKVKEQLATNKLNAEYMEVLRLGYLESNIMKIEADNINQGNTFIQKNGQYVPLWVEKSVIATPTTSASANAQDNYIAEYGINKHRVANAHAQLRLVNASTAFKMHSSQLSKTRHMLLALRNLDIALGYNHNKGLNEEKFNLSPETVLEYIIKNSDPTAREYFVKLLQDEQGMSQVQSKFLGKMRNAWIKTVLGANIKTVFNQLSGYPMASIHVKHRYLLKAATVGKFSGRNKAAFEYFSAYGVARTHGRSAARAKGIDGHIGRIGNALTWGIQFMDNAMMHKIWTACVMQIEAKYKKKLEFGVKTVVEDGREIEYVAENIDVDAWNECAELFEKVVRETQSNDFTIERTAAQRHNNEVVRFIAGIFTGDAAKMLSNVFRNHMYIRNAKRGEKMAKAEITKLSELISKQKNRLQDLTRQYETINHKDYDAVLDHQTLVKKEQEQLDILEKKLVLNEEYLGKIEAAIKKAHKHGAKSVAALLQSQMVFVLISMLFSMLRKEKDEEGNSVVTWGEALKRYAESLYGLLPIVRDVIPAMTKGYKVEHYAYSMLNDLIDSVKAVSDVAIKGLKGDAVTKVDVNKSVRGLLLATGASLGIPLRNIERIMRTMMGWVSDYDYTYQAAIYGANTKDIDAALSRNDHKLAREILRMRFMQEYVGHELDEATLDALLKLYEGRENNDFKLPTTAPKDKMAYTDDDGKSHEHKMSKKDMEIMKASYAKASGEVNKLIKSSKYLQSSDKEKAKAVNGIYSYYYDTAKRDVLKDGNYTKVTNADVIGKLMSPSDMAILLSRLSSFKPDLMNNGKAKPNSKKSKVLVELNGYSLSYENKQIVLLALGYAPSNKTATKRAISRKGLSDAEQQYLIDRM